MNEPQMSFTQDELVARKLTLENRKRQRELAKKAGLAATYSQLLLVLAGKMDGLGWDSRVVCDKAMDMAKWSQAVWVEDNPETDDELMSTMGYVIPGCSMNG